MTATAPMPAGSVSADARMTFEEFESNPDLKGFELVDGYLVEKEVGLLESRSASKLHQVLREHVEAHRLGDVFDSEAIYRCFDDPSRGRKPDLSFIAAGRLTQEDLHRGHSTIPPDLAVEVVSPNDVYIKVIAKVREYLQAGVKVVWLVNPRQQEVAVYFDDGRTVSLSGDDRLDAGDVLPKLSVTVGEIFADTTA
ncbi:MAG: Uma2 family endonuclease [Planctomycetota bacterium]